MLNIPTETLNNKSFSFFVTTFKYSDKSKPGFVKSNTSNKYRRTRQVSALELLTNIQEPTTRTNIIEEIDAISFQQLHTQIPQLSKYVPIEENKSELGFETVINNYKNRNLLLSCYLQILKYQLSINGAHNQTVVSVILQCIPGHMKSIGVLNTVYVNTENQKLYSEIIDILTAKTTWLIERENIKNSNKMYYGTNKYQIDLCILLMNYYNYNYLSKTSAEKYLKVAKQDPEKAEFEYGYNDYVYDEHSISASQYIKAKTDFKTQESVTHLYQLPTQKINEDSFEKRLIKVSVNHTINKKITDKDTFVFVMLKLITRTRFFYKKGKLSKNIVRDLKKHEAIPILKEKSKKFNKWWKEYIKNQI